MTQMQSDKKMTGSLNNQEQLQLSLEPFNEMGSRLETAPLAISVLFHLCLISSKGDFDLRIEDSGHQFEFLRFPDSFRACLSQVASSGCHAFSKADSAMECIRILTIKVQKRLQTVQKLLYGPDTTPEDLSNFLPINLKAIEKVANECIEEASSVEKEFEKVIYILEELQQATLRKQGKVKEAQAITQRKIENEESKKKKLEQQEKEAKQDLEAAKKEVDKYTKRFDEALNQQTNLVSQYAAVLVEGVTNTFSAVTSAASEATMAFTKRLKKIFNPAHMFWGGSSVGTTSTLFQTENPESSESPSEDSKLRKVTQHDLICQDLETSHSLAQITANEALKKMEMTKNAMESAKRRSDEINNRVINILEQMDSNKMKLKQNVIEEMNQKAVLEVISNGLKAFAALRDQWAHFIQFFKSIARLVNCSMSEEINTFLSNAKIISQSESRTKAGKEIVFQSAFQSEEVAYVVHLLSTTYCKISKEYLMPLNSKLFHLLALDNDKEAHKIKVEEDLLQANAKKISEEIKRIVNDNHNKYKASCHPKRKTVERELQKIAPTPKEEKENAAIEVKN